MARGSALAIGPIVALLDSPPVDHLCGQPSLPLVSCQRLWLMFTNAASCPLNAAKFRCFRGSGRTWRRTNQAGSQQDSARSSTPRNCVQRLPKNFGILECRHAHCARARAGGSSHRTGEFVPSCSTRARAQTGFLSIPHRHGPRTRSSMQSRAKFTRVTLRYSTHV